MSLLVAASAFLLGAIPFAVLVGRRAGVDPRTAGSGNPGATNVLRTVGRLAGAGVLALDVAKGWVAVWAASRWAPAGWAAQAAAVAVVAGHVWSPWLRLRGGKGVATACGATAALAPRVLPVPLAAFALVYGATRRVSAASVAAVGTLAVAAWIDRALTGNVSFATALCAVVLALVVLWTHRGNLRRLFSGREPRTRL